MQRRSIDARRIKIHRSYTIAEAAEELGIHKNTMANWLRQGLKVIDGQRPILIHGAELRRFLSERRRERKSSCKSDEFWCLRCRAPRKPYGGLVDLIATPGAGGNLRGLCPECGCLMHRRASEAKLATVGAYFDVKIPHDQSRLRDCPSPSLNCVFEGAADERANIQR